MERKTVYSAYNRRVVFEGSADECWAWLMSQATKLDSGCRVFREWTADGDRYIDVGNVYIFNNQRKFYLSKSKKFVIIYITKGEKLYEKVLAI